ncbi:MAG: OmpA family protein [Pseudomonadota bacterium]
MISFIKKATTISLAIALTACTTNPYTGERQASNTALYGAGAAAVCGLIGAIESGKHARNAALGCGVVGAGVGAYMDAQEAKLREELSNTGVSVRREGDKIRLIMPGNITFASGSSDINGNFYEVLKGVGMVLAKYKDTDISIVGHTDNVGSDGFNQGLSEKRARSVAQYLSTKGVAWERLRVSGAGKRFPVASNTTSQGRAQNRRVELEIIARQS